MKITREKTLPAGVVGIIYGPEGIGKTSLAAALDRPLFVDAEHGAHGLDVDKVEGDVTLEGILRTMQEISVDHMGYRTLVLDTADYIEQKLIQDFCAEKKISSIEDIPYGKGYTMCAERFFRILEKARSLANSGMDVVFVCHAEIKKFEMPDERGSYDRWNLKLTKQTAPKMKEAVDFMTFVNYRTNIVSADKSVGETKAHATGGRRWCYTSHTTAFDAKRRVFIDLPDDCSLDEMTKRLPAALRKATSAEAPAPVREQAPAETREATHADDPLDGAVHDVVSDIAEKIQAIPNERECISKLREAMRAYGLTEEQVFAYGSPRHDRKFGHCELKDWNKEFVKWLLDGMDQIADRIKAF